MTPSEFNRLRQFDLANKRRFRPSRTVHSRRAMKSVGSVGWFRGSRVVNQVHLETVFNKPNWTKYQR